MENITVYKIARSMGIRTRPVLSKAGLIVHQELKQFALSELVESKEQYGKKQITCKVKAYKPAATKEIMKILNRVNNEYKGKSQNQRNKRPRIKEGLRPNERQSRRRRRI